MASIGFRQQFDTNVSFIISEFLVPVPLKFCDWVKLDMLDWISISKTENENLLQNYFQYIDFVTLSENTKATNLIDAIAHSTYSDKLDLQHLYSNPTTINSLQYLIEKSKPKQKNEYRWYRDNIYWLRLCKNPNGIKLLQKYTKNYTTNMQKLNWHHICWNPNGLEFLKNYTDNFTINMKAIDWNGLCKNPNAVPIIKQLKERFPNKIDWNSLCKNPNGMELLEEFLKENPKNKDIISVNSWEKLSQNEFSIPLLENLVNHSDVFLHKIIIYVLCENPSGLNLLKMKTQNFTKNTVHMNLPIFFQNPNAMNVIETWYNNKYLMDDYFFWTSLNPNGIPFLTKHPQFIDWMFLQQNPNGIDLIIQNREMLECPFNYKMNWFFLSRNPNAYNLMKEKLHILTHNNGSQNLENHQINWTGKQEIFNRINIKEVDFPGLLQVHPSLVTETDQAQYKIWKQCMQKVVYEL